MKESWHEGDQVESIKSDNDALLISKRSNTTDSHILRPLLTGCLTGQLHALFSYWNQADVNELFHNPITKKALNDFKLANMKELKVGILQGATYRTASLGLFEILRKKLRTRNEGKPLSLYQEACCGLASGATAALVWQPFTFPYNKLAAENFSYRNMFNNVDQIVRNRGVLALWRGSGVYVAIQATASAGMLTSYDRSLNYLMESKGFSKWTAVISASIISGFFAAACSHPCAPMKAIKDFVQKRYHAGDMHAYRNIPFYVSRILNPRNGFFYVEFLNQFRRWAAYCLVQWYIYEQIRTVEEYMDHGTPDGY